MIDNREENIKTLVIHPKDSSTDFLKEIYCENDWNTVDTKRFHGTDLISIIESYERIVMLGHGTPAGLLGNSSYIINSDFISALRKKPCVSIWCNADRFCVPANIKGFYTGMIISEVGEALYCGVDATQAEVDYSNMLFSYAIKKAIVGKDMLKIAKELYTSDVNPVIKYNMKNLYFR